MTHSPRSSNAHRSRGRLADPPAPGRLVVVAVTALGVLIAPLFVASYPVLAGAMVAASLGTWQVVRALYARRPERAVRTLGPSDLASDDRAADDRAADDRAADDRAADDRAADDRQAVPRGR